MSNVRRHKAHPIDATIPQVRSLTALVLAGLATACQADTVDRSTTENITAFATRHAPNRQSTVVRVAEHRAWDYALPVIVAFYEYPVALADPSKNYGTDPHDSEVLGYVFVPKSAAQYERIEVDGYGPEGTNANVDEVSFVSRSSAPAVLQVQIGWRNNHGEYLQVCSYLKPQLEQHPKKLQRVKSAKCGA
jgi:hypothetical protein